MKFFNIIKKFYKEKFTFLIIPHDGKAIQQRKLNKLSLIMAISFVSVTLLFFIFSTLYLYSVNKKISDELLIKEDKINNLQIISEQQVSEIENLKATSKFVVEKLSQLNDLEKQIKSMIGLPVEDNPVVTSRSIDSRFDDILDYQAYLDGLNGDEIVDLISRIIDEERERYDKLIKDVEKQLKFLDSKPDKWPVSGEITSKFGNRKDPVTGKKDFHNGIDISNKVNTTIVAAGSGIVTYSGWSEGYGRVIIISHGYGYKTVYAHNNSNLVKVGDRVNKGDAIAKLGNSGKSTGPHLHFEIHYNGTPIDPLKVLN